MVAAKKAAAKRSKKRIGKRCADISSGVDLGEGGPAFAQARAEPRAAATNTRSSKPESDLSLGSPARDPHPGLSVQAAYIFQLPAELRLATSVLSGAIPKRTADNRRIAERNALARLLRLARMGSRREQMHNRDRVYAEAQHAAQIADHAALMERLDFDGEVRNAWPPITIVGDIPPDIASHPALKELAKLVERRHAGLAVADQVGNDSRSGKLSRRGAAASVISRGAASSARDEELYAAFLDRFPSKLAPPKGSHLRTPAVVSVAREFKVHVRTVRNAISRLERKMER